MATPVGFSAGSLLSHTAKCFRACSEVTDGGACCWKNGRMLTEALARQMEEFLGGSRHAVVVEDGARIFDLNESKYSISGEYKKVSPTPVVVGAERGAADPGLRGPQRQPSTHGAEAGPVASVAAGDWQGPRPPPLPRLDGRRGQLIRRTYGERSQGTSPISPLRS
jgi:hypothetical protein